MRIRRHLAVVSLAAFVLAACGDDEASTNTTPDTDAPADTQADPPADSEPPRTDAPTDSETGGDGYTHPTGADEAIVSVADLAGFTTPRFAFSMPPRLIISGDGMAYTPGATTAIFPGVLVPPMQVQPISEDGIQAVLAAADEAGLFADIDYEDESTQLIADAPTTVVTISVDGETWEHSAYALGFDGLPEGDQGTSPEREALQSFVEQLSDLAAVAGDESLGEPEVFVPDAYEIVATPVEDPSALAVDGIEPTVVEWPATAGVELAETGQCTRIGADAVGALFEEANELTLFSEDDVTYEVFVRPALPGRTCAG